MKQYFTINISPDEFNNISQNLTTNITDPLQTIHTWTKKFNNIQIEIKLRKHPDNPACQIDGWLYDTKHEYVMPFHITDLDDSTTIYYLNHIIDIILAKPEDISVYVEQQPVMVSYECPTCLSDIHIGYSDFCDNNGEPTDWHMITCPTCGQKLIIDSQDWN